MKLAPLFAPAFIAVSMAAVASPPPVAGVKSEPITPSLAAELKIFRVQDFALRSGVLRVRMKDAAVTRMVYEAVTEGVCSEHARDAAFSSMGIQKIEVLDSRGEGGFALNARCEPTSTMALPSRETYWQRFTVRCEAGRCGN